MRPKWRLKVDELRRSLWSLLSKHISSLATENKKSEHELQEAALWIHDEWWNKTLTRINMLLWKLKMEITSRGKKTQTQNPVKVRRQKAVQTSDVIINELAKESCLFNTKDTVSLIDKVFTLCAHQEYFQICYSSIPDLSLHRNQVAWWSDSWLDLTLAQRWAAYTLRNVSLVLFLSLLDTPFALLFTLEEERLS